MRVKSCEHKTRHTTTASPTGVSGEVKGVLISQGMVRAGADDLTLRSNDVITLQLVEVSER